MSDNLEEAAYYIRFIRMYIDLATEAVLKVFFHVIPSQSVDTLFASDDVKKKLESMRKTNILSRREYELVSRPHIRPASFDLSLLITLLTNLFSGKLTSPKNGWKLPVAATDHTIAADLLRLREIRNKIITHQPSAKLIKSKFERLWDDVKNILVRLIQQVDSNYVTTLEEMIKVYENTSLDPHDSFGTYLDKIQEWFDEVLNLQSEVEGLSSNMKELQLFFTTKPARYSRYIRLLFEGGKLVLRGLLKSLLSERGQTLHVTLQGKCSKLREQIGDEELLKQLFPNASDIAETNLDIDTWDIAVLACVVICLLNDNGNSEDVINGVASILKARKSYADSALVALDNERFSTVSEDLLMNLSMLSTRLDAQDRTRFKEIIATNENENFEKYFKELNSHGVGIKSIVDTYNETLCQLKGYLKTMADTGVPFLANHILDLKIVTLGNDDEKRKAVEDTVAIVWQAALENSRNMSDFTTVRESLDTILNDIRRIPDVEVDSIRRKCILFSLKCKSWRAIFQLVEYFESATFKKQLRTISIEVSLLQDDVISLQGHLTLESVLDILNRTQTDDETAYTLCVPIKCSSVRGMKEVLKVLTNEETTNRFLEIADSLSQTGHEISLNVYPEVYGFKEVFSETDSDSGISNFEEEKADTSLGNKKRHVHQHFIPDGSAAKSGGAITSTADADGNFAEKGKVIGEENPPNFLYQETEYKEEKSQGVQQIQRLKQTEAENTESHLPRAASSQDCRRCRCSRCTCRCHLLALNEKWKREENSESYGTNKISCNIQFSQDTESDVELLPDFYDSSDSFDLEFPFVGDTPVTEKKKEKRKMPSSKEKATDHATVETHGASGGDLGQPPNDDPSGDDDNDDGHMENRKKTVKWEIDPDAWKSCIEMDFKNRAACLLDQGKLPNQVLLNEICFKYKRTNSCVQRICKYICSYIKNKSEFYLDVWAAYRYKKSDTSYGNEIVFVVLTKDTDNEDIQEFTTYKRCIHGVTTQEENCDLRSKEREDPLSSVKLQDLERSLRENAVAQMERHSKLTRVTVSWYKSTGYGTKQYSQQKQPCIALYVHVKGYVPLNEEPFSYTIDGYCVDVREGVFLLNGGGPNDYHRNVKMGCMICGQSVKNRNYLETGQGEEYLKYLGTLGAFIEFENDKNLYALTSAHVLFVGERLQNILDKGIVNYDQNTEIVYQPADSTSEFGKTMFAFYREGANGIPGMEIAVMQISSERMPDSGTFPDDSTYIEKGFGPDKPLEFYTGKVCKPTRLSDSRLVFKYGSQTKLTEGLCRVHGASVRTQFVNDRIFDVPITLHGQIEIESTRSTEFAAHGDSGALVLTRSSSELVAVGIFEGEIGDVYLMTPMWSILDELERLKSKKCKLKTFQSCNPRPRDMIFEDSDSVNEKLETINQRLTYNLAVHKDEIRNELAVHKNEMKKQADEQKQELKDHMTSAIQDLLLALKGQNSA